MRRAEIALDVFLGVATFLSADDHDFLGAEAGEAADHGMVLRKEAVAMQFAEVGKSLLQIIQGIGPGRMAGELDALPCGQIGENLFAGLDQLAFNLGDFIVHIDVEGMGRLVLFEFVQLVLQLENGFFEIKLVLHSSAAV